MPKTGKIVLLRCWRWKCLDAGSRKFEADIPGVAGNRGAEFPALRRFQGLGGKIFAGAGFLQFSVGNIARAVQVHEGNDAHDSTNCGQSFLRNLGQNLVLNCGGFRRGGRVDGLRGNGFC